MAVWAWVLSLIACVGVPPSGRPFEAVREQAADAQIDAAPASDKPLAVDPVAEGDPGEGGFDFDADGRGAESPGEGVDPTAEEAAAALGLTALPEGYTPPAPVAAIPAAPVAPVAAPAPVPSMPAYPPPPVNWGIRLVSTVPDAQPPRAILGLGTGKEVVVVPGDLLPEARVVVLAIGRDAVQVAEVTPVGDHATVQTYTVSALFPSAQIALPR